MANEKNLIPIKKGERRAAKSDADRKDFILAGRVKPENLSIAKKLIAETGSKSEAVNYLLEQQLKK